MAPRGDTKARIIDAALSLFADQGYGGTSISDIERRVGLAAGTGSFYRHFESKEAVLRDAVDQEVDRVLAESADERAALPGLDDPEAMRAQSYEQVLRDVRRFDRLIRILRAEGTRPFPDVRHTILDGLARAGTGPWADDPQTLVAITAIAGYDLLSHLQGSAFVGVDAADFIQLLVDVTAPGPVGRRPGENALFEVRHPLR